MYSSSRANDLFLTNLFLTNFSLTLSRKYNIRLINYYFFGE